MTQTLQREKTTYRSTGEDAVIITLDQGTDMAFPMHLQTASSRTAFTCLRVLRDLYGLKLVLYLMVVLL
jgi:hypothetical protein